ncbi:MAG: hypothetical protein ABH879_07190 [archaeon]
MSKTALSRTAAIITGLVLFVVLVLSVAYAEPIGPAVKYVKNSSRNNSAAALINTTGGSITTMVLNASQQNMRWKAYVGNVSGELSLRDADNYSIFDWSLGTIEGEVYATRSSDSVNWSHINCSNSTHIYNEELAMNHTNNPNDNITATFAAKDHSPFYIGTRLISADSCYSIHTNVNGSNQSSSFEEMVLYDGTGSTGGNFVYATLIENDVFGYDRSKYDFQMILPENGLDTWSSSTAYYFYVELS